MILSSFRALLWLLVVCAPALSFADEPQILGLDSSIDITLDDWPWWRGLYRNGEAAAGQSPPVRWSDTQNVLWKSPILGRGHGSPIVIGEQVILQTADPDREVQGVSCYDRKTGALLWDRPLHQGGFVKKQNAKSTSANSTPATDGRRIYVNFLHNDAIYTTALDRNGKPVWQKKITDYVLHQGFSSSPGIYQSLVIVSADNKGTGVIVGLDRATGETVWRQERPKLPNYTSPIIFRLNGRDELFFTGCNLVTSLDPLSGKKFWEYAGSTTECVTSTVTDGRRIFTSGGYPKNHLAAMEADGSGRIAWENSSRVYVPSMVFRDGRLYAMLDAGVAACWNSETGAELWKERVGGTFSASLVLAGENIYATDEAGKTLVFRADPKEFQLVAENQLGNEAFATAVFCGSRIYQRVAEEMDGKRQEFLYCLGDPSAK